MPRRAGAVGQYKSSRVIPQVTAALSDETRGGYRGEEAVYFFFLSFFLSLSFQKKIFIGYKHTAIVRNS